MLNQYVLQFSFGGSNFVLRVLRLHVNSDAKNRQCMGIHVTNRHNSGL
jgi:hypothetical protein